MRWSDLVGREFKAFGGIYECVEWDRRKGLRMVLKGGKEGFVGRKIGDETWVSERAIDRTYHTVPQVSRGPADKNGEGRGNE
jgi:hypothetical protein